MNNSPAPVLLITDARIDSILTELDARGSDMAALDTLAAGSDVAVDRVVEGPDITYARLAGHAEDGGPIVLMHFEGLWERATKAGSPLPTRQRAQAAIGTRPVVSIRSWARARKGVPFGRCA